MMDHELSPEELRAQRLRALEEIEIIRKSQPPASEAETLEMLWEGRRRYHEFDDENNSDTKQ
jgi:hypothetical protein